MANLIGALRVSLSADTAQFSAGMKKAQREAVTSSAAISKAVGLAKAGIVGFASGLSIGLLSNGIKAALDYAGSLGEISQQLGVTTRDLQVFRYAAGQLGVSQEEVDKGLGKLTITLGQVAAGAKAPTDALNAIGVSAKDVAGLDAGGAFRKIADGLSTIGDRSQRAAVEVALFGRTGAKLDTLLSGGSTALNELARAAEELGIVLSDSQIQRADETADKLEAVKTVLAAQISGVVADNAGSILSLSSSLASLTSSIVKFLGSNPAAALSILGALAGSRVGGLPGAAAGAFVGATIGANMASNNFPPENIPGGAALRRHNLVAERKRIAAIRKRGGHVRQSELDRLIRLNDKVRADQGAVPVATATGGSVGQFLAGGGGGSGRKPKADPGAGKADRGRIDAIRDAFRFDEDMRRADMDILRAKQSLSTDFVERAALEIEMLNLERASYQAELANQVAMGEISQAQAAQKQAKYDIADSLNRQAVLADEETKRQEVFNRLEGVDYQNKRELLEQQSGLADTAAERRRIELQILDLALQEARERQARLERESTDWAEIEEGRRNLSGLEQRQAGMREGVRRDTRGPLEGYLAGVPDSADKMNEALENVAVNGLQSVQDGIVDVISGAKSMGAAFKGIANQIIADLVRIQLQKMIVGALGKALGGLGGLSGGGAPNINPGDLSGSLNIAGASAFAVPKLGFATGGGFTILGNQGRDKNIMSLNGLPIARVSHGERVNISNDNANARGGGAARVTIVPTPYFDAHVDGRAAQVAAPMASRAAMVGAAGGQQATMRRQRQSIP